MKRRINFRLARTAFNILCLIALLFIVGVQFVRVGHVSEPVLRSPLSETLSAELRGWRVKDRTLGETEAVRYRVGQVLNFDDYVYREYGRGDLSFSAYVAYWGPGKMPVRMVNAHNPDRCWSLVGWRCTALESKVEKTLAEGSLKPAEWRVFEKKNHKEYVYYWHVVGDRIHSYGGFADAPPVTFILTDLWNYGFNQRREQFFVRINSSQPFDRLWDEPGFQKILGQLRDLCLAGP